MRRAYALDAPAEGVRPVLQQDQMRRAVAPAAKTHRAPLGARFA
jgi:hypothetical protein